MAKGLESIVNKEHHEVKKTKRHFDIAHVLGTIGSYVGSAAFAYLGNRITHMPYLSAALGSSLGDYVGYDAGFTPYWYWKNRDRYKGLKGKTKFLKDFVSFNARAIPLDLAAYAVGVPLAIGATFLTGNPVLGTVLAGIATDIGYWLGLRKLNKRKIQEVAAEKAYKPSYNANKPYATSYA
ncbi:hypothetical protein HYX05_03350 [Candidatus Woesearchaeota archaeon]|nr:hypothetical protein [Candidatus Woesearchaeota archaeon]